MCFHMPAQRRGVPALAASDGALLVAKELGNSLILVRTGRTVFGTRKIADGEVGERELGPVVVAGAGWTRIIVVARGDWHCTKTTRYGVTR
jgi:hypothetical protein